MANEESKLKISRAYWATAPMDCWQCSHQTSVTALLALPPTTEIEDGQECTIDEPLFLIYPEGWPNELLAQLREINPLVEFDFSRTIEEEYLMNHCGNCAAKIGDHYMFEPDGPFYSSDPDAFKKVKLVEAIVRGFELDAYRYIRSDQFDPALDHLLPSWRHISGT